MTSAESLTGPNVAAGPLVVSEVNPRYFTVAAGEDRDRTAVYLTGSHTWNNFHDGLGPGGSCADTAEHNDYRAYLEFSRSMGTTSSGCGAGNISNPRPPAAHSIFV